MEEISKLSDGFTGLMEALRLYDDEIGQMLRKLAILEGILKPCPMCGSMNQKPQRTDLEIERHKFPDSGIMICKDCGQQIMTPATLKRINEAHTIRADKTDNY